MLVLDIETLDIESTAVVLSASMVYFDENDTWESLLKKAVFVKFDAKDQIKNYKRTVSKDTLSWWNTQSDDARNVSFNPKPDDVTVEKGISILREYLKNDTNPTKIIWVRGSLDQMVIDSLCRSAKLEPLARYNHYRDIRTGIDILSESSVNGYCEVRCDNFNKDWVQKHNPIHDIAYDAMQLLHPN